ATLGGLLVVTTGLLTTLIAGRRIVIALLLGTPCRCPLVHAALATTTVQHLHLAIDVHHHLGGVAVLTILPLPFASLQLTFDVDLGTFPQVLPGHLGDLAEQHDTVPFGFRDHLPGLTVLVALVGSQVKVDDRVPIRGIAGFRVLPQIADQNNLVYASCHVLLLTLFHLDTGIPAGLLGIQEALP